MVAVRNYELGGLKQEKLNLSQFWRPETHSVPSAWNQGIIGASAPSGVPRKSAASLFQLLVATHSVVCAHISLQSWRPTPSNIFALCSHHLLYQISLWLSKTIVMTFRAHPDILPISRSLKHLQRPFFQVRHHIHRSQQLWLWLSRAVNLQTRFFLWVLPLLFTFPWLFLFPCSLFGDQSSSVIFFFFFCLCYVLSTDFLLADQSILPFHILSKVTVCGLETKPVTFHTWAPSSHPPHLMLLQ